MRLNATNVRRIACGQWGRVYDEMTGAAEPEDLDRVFAVQMGKAVEPFLLAWMKLVHGWACIITDDDLAHMLADRVRLQALNPDPTRWWIERDGYSCRPDGLGILHASVTPTALLEVKMTNERTTAEAAIARYMPQVQLNAWIVGVERAVLGVAYGNTRMTCYFTRQDETYLQALLAEADAFRFHLELGTRPGDPAVPFVARVAPPPTTTRPWKEDEPCASGSPGTASSKRRSRSRRRPTPSTTSGPATGTTSPAVPST